MRRYGPREPVALVRLAEREQGFLVAPGNPLRIVSLADRMLSRNGRMIVAIRAIGPGMAAYQSEPFRLDLE